MSTKTREDIAAIEHLDHQPECDGIFHGNNPRPPAKLWLDVHGCTENLFCLTCNAQEQQVVNQMIESGDPRCKHCAKQIRSYSDLYTRVVPL
ncbi:hypothetical protein ACFYY5_29330 [Nocardia elegans]|uniref:Uncharacterized protein n=1 Tax=Nocardia elegans TaxID=300029 RepID=A0ABW6TLE3_9NOCA